MNSTAASPWTAPVDWSHEYTPRALAPGRDARAFVKVQLVAHHLGLLVDVVGVVAAILARDVALRSSTPPVVSLTRRGRLLELEVADASPGRTEHPTRPSLLDVPAGSGILGLLTEGWGVTWVSGCATGLWATFEASQELG